MDGVGHALNGAHGSRKKVVFGLTQARCSGARGGFGLGLFVRQGQLFLDLLEVLQRVDFHRRS
jgi:hypothetical protein